MPSVLHQWNFRNYDATNWCKICCYFVHMCETCNSIFIVMRLKDTFTLLQSNILKNVMNLWFILTGINRLMWLCASFVWYQKATNTIHPSCAPQSGYVRGFNHPCGCICVPVSGWVTKQYVCVCLCLCVKSFSLCPPCSFPESPTKPRCWLFSKQTSEATSLALWSTRSSPPAWPSSTATWPSLLNHSRTFDTKSSIPAWGLLTSSSDVHAIFNSLSQQ